MQRTATITYHGGGESDVGQLLATAAYTVDEGLASNPIRTFLLRAPFTIPGVGEFVVESAMVAHTGNTSLAVRRLSEPPGTLLLAGWGWNSALQPYFDVALASGGSIQIYLASSDPSAERV